MNALPSIAAGSQQDRPWTAALLDDLTPGQIATAKAAYFRHLLEEEKDIRLAGFVDLDDEGGVIGVLPKTLSPALTSIDRALSIGGRTPATNMQGQE